MDDALRREALKRSISDATKSLSALLARRPLLGLVLLASVCLGNSPDVRAAEKAALRVRAMDSVNRVPLQGVGVKVLGTTRGGITDETGWSSIEGTTPGPAHLLVLFQSFRLDTAIEILPEQTTTIVVQVPGVPSPWVEDYEPGAYGLSDLTVVVRDSLRRRAVRGVIVYLRDSVNDLRQGSTNRSGRVKFKHVVGGDAHVWTRDTLGFKGKAHLVELMHERPECDSLFLEREEPAR